MKNIIFGLCLIFSFSLLAATDAAQKVPKTPLVKKALPPNIPARVEDTIQEEKPITYTSKKAKYSEAAIKERRQKRRSSKKKKEKTYVDKNGWQSDLGRVAMEKYIERLLYLCQQRLPGMVTGIAGGKKGILLSVTFKAKRNFYLAQENTKDFLTAIVEDLEKLPEPVVAQVYITNNGQQIISAMRPRQGQPVKVKYLL